MDDPYGHPSLLGLPNDVMAKLMGYLDIQKQISLRLVCRQFSTSLPIQIHILQVIFCSKYAQVHLQNRHGKFLSLEYEHLQDAWGPCVFVRNMTSSNFKKLGTGSVGHHLAQFLGRLLSNHNIFVGGLEMDFTSRLRPLSGDPSQFVFEFLVLLQSKMVTRGSSLPLNHLTMELIPPALIPSTVSLFAPVQLRLNSGIVCCGIDELVQMPSWQNLRRFHCGTLQAVPQSNHLAQLTEVIIQVEVVTKADLLNIRDAFYEYATLDQFRVYCAKLTFSDIMDAFGSDDQDNLDMALWVWPILGTEDTLFVNFSEELKFVDFTRSPRRDVITID